MRAGALVLSQDHLAVGHEPLLLIVLAFEFIAAVLAREGVDRTPSTYKCMLIRALFPITRKPAVFIVEVRVALGAVLTHEKIRWALRTDAYVLV